jgi:hypothetical protein
MVGDGDQNAFGIEITGCATICDCCSTWQITAMSKVVFGACISFHEYTKRLTNSVVVGNVPYNMGEVRVTSINSVSSSTNI